MNRSKPPVCITCGLPAGTPPQLNRLSNGQVCPACRNRLLDWLPPVLPSRAREPSTAVEVTIPAREPVDVPDERA